MLFPGVVTSQIDMVPMNRCNVLEQRLINGISMGTHRVDCPFQVDRVPQDNRRHNQIEAAGSVTLKLVGMIPDFAKPVEAHGAGQCIFRLTLVQAGSHALAQARVEQPVQRKNSALDAPNFAQCKRQAVLSWMGSLQKAENKAR
jgi:hypothetical protein